MLDLDNFLTLKDEVKFQLYSDALEQISYFKNLLTTLSTNLQMPKPSKELLKLDNCINEKAENQNNSSKFNSHQEHAQHSKISKWPIQPKPYQPHVIQTRGVAARNAPLSALPPITDFSKDVTEEQEIPRAKLQHLSLPKDVNIDALIIGDSITNRVNGNQVGSRVVARGFGGQTTSMLLDRTSNTKARKVSQVFIFIGINDCLSPDFDVNVSAASYEKLIYTVNHKFCPDVISLCLLTPVAAFRKDSIGNVKSFNTKIKAFAKNIKDVQNAKISVIDFFSDFSQNPTLLSSDGLHPSVDGIKCIVNTLRNSCESNGLDTSSEEITMRPRINKRNLSPHPNEMMQMFHRYMTSNYQR